MSPRIRYHLAALATLAEELPEHRRFLLDLRESHRALACDRAFYFKLSRKVR
jgi:hypothetical protein